MCGNPLEADCTVEAIKQVQHVEPETLIVQYPMKPLIGHPEEKESQQELALRAKLESEQVTGRARRPSTPPTPSRIANRSRVA